MTTYINSLNEDVNEIQMFLNYNEVQYFAEADKDNRGMIKKIIDWIKNVVYKIVRRIRSTFKKIFGKFTKNRIKPTKDFSETVNMVKPVEMPKATDMKDMEGMAKFILENFAENGEIGDSGIVLKKEDVPLTEDNYVICDKFLFDLNGAKYDEQLREYADELRAELERIQRGESPKMNITPTDIQQNLHAAMSIMNALASISNQYLQFLNKYKELLQKERS